MFNASWLRADTTLVLDGAHETALKFTGDPREWRQ